MIIHGIIRKRSGLVLFEDTHGQQLNLVDADHLEDGQSVSFQLLVEEENDETEEDEDIYREVVVPCTKIGDAGDKTARPWTKLITSVDMNARDQSGFEGHFVTRGGLEDMAPGTMVLEMAGRKSRLKGNRTYILWLLDDEYEWDELARSDDPSWAKELREAASEAAGEEDEG